MRSGVSAVAVVLTSGPLLLSCASQGSTNQVESVETRVAQLPVEAGIPTESPTSSALDPTSTATPTSSPTISPSPTSSPTPSPTPSPPKRKVVNVAATGDFLIHGAVFRRALRNGGGNRYDFDPMFRSIRKYIKKADVAICHFEVPMTGGSPAGYPSFNSPRSLANSAKRTGWDICSTASNHTLDKGQSGVDATLKTIRKAGLVPSGSAESKRRARKTPMVKVNGTRVALLSYTDSTNGIPRPYPYSVNLIDPTRITKDAARARRAGAELVIVNMHWGAEYQSAVTARQAELADQLTASRHIDAVIGQHVHVVQPIRFVNGKPVVFGEGNLVSNQSAACCAVGSNDGMIATLKFVIKGDRVKSKKVSYVPVTVRRPDYLVVPIGLGAKSGLMSLESLRASYTRTVSVVGRTKKIKPVPQTSP
ncbi:MAG: CapA family protein [Actinomycetia bacterium]|nr:CapA family protein [Actinomycetes bacterium]MCH9800051.1 CapA family protein [Actinomycetes bacterium]